MTGPTDPTGTPGAPLEADALDAADQATALPETTAEPAPGLADDLGAEVPEADALEQRQDAVEVAPFAGDPLGDGAPLEADPLDAADSARGVPLEDEVDR